MKKFKVKTRKIELHRIWSLYIRTRDKYCQWCKSRDKVLEAHHIVTKARSGNSGRFEVENGMALCYYCHKNRIPNDPDEYIAFRDKWLKERGLNYHELKAKYDECFIHFTQDFYELKKKVITEMTEAL